MEPNPDVKAVALARQVIELLRPRPGESEREAWARYDLAQTLCGDMLKSAGSLSPNMTPQEMIAEWRRGCSNAPPDRPEVCPICTRALIEALDRALRRLPYSYIKPQH